MNQEKKPSLDNEIWRKLEEDHEKLCCQDPEYQFLKNQVENLYKELISTLSLEHSSKFMEYEIKKNLLSAIEVEAAYKQGKYINYRLKDVNKAQ